MKSSPQKDMKSLAAFNLFLGSVGLVGDILLIVEFLRLNSLHWDQLSRTESIHHAIMVVLGIFTFCLMPCASFICIRNAWIIRKHIDRFSDESHDA